MSSILNSSYSTFDLARAVVANHDPRTKQTTDKAAYSHQVSVSFKVEMASPGSGAGGTSYNAVIMGLHRGIEQVDKVDICSFHANRGGRRYEIQCQYPRMVMKYEDGSFTMNVRVASLEFRTQPDFDKIIHMIEDLSLKYKPFITQKGQPVPRGSTTAPYSLGPGPHTPAPYRAAYTASPAPSPSGFGSPAFDFSINERIFSPSSQALSQELGPSGYLQYADPSRGHSQSSPLKNDAFGGVHDSQPFQTAHEPLNSIPGSGSQGLVPSDPFPSDPIAYNRQVRNLMPPPQIPSSSSITPRQVPPSAALPALPAMYGSETSIPSTPMRMLEASRAKGVRPDPVAPIQARRLGGDINEILPPPRTLPFQPTVQKPTPMIASDESTADEGDSDEELKGSIGRDAVLEAASKATKPTPETMPSCAKKSKRVSQADSPPKASSPKKKAKTSPKKSSPIKPKQIKSPPPKPKNAKSVQNQSAQEDKTDMASEERGPSEQFNGVLTSLLMCPDHMLAAIEQKAPWLLGQGR